MTNLKSAKPKTPLKKTPVLGLSVAVKRPSPTRDHEHAHDHSHASAPNGQLLGASPRVRKTTKLTPNEASVEKILAKARKPMSAYDIIPLMTKKLGHTVAPVTVYRALQNLTEQGLVTRIESQNAYVLCRHPNEEHDCLFFICRNCGATTEAPDDGIRSLLKKEAEHLGFGVDKQILEVVGLCKECGAKGG